MYLFSIQNSTLFLGQYLDVSKFVKLTMETALYKRSSVLWVCLVHSIKAHVQMTVQCIRYDMKDQVLQTTEAHASSNALSL